VVLCVTMGYGLVMLLLMFGGLVAGRGRSFVPDVPAGLRPAGLGLGTFMFGGLFVGRRRSPGSGALVGC
jgi:hypothetical protein